LIAVIIDGTESMIRLW